MVDLRAAVVIDYQNVHLTGHELFSASKHRPRHESLIDPLHFANQLIISRNAAQRPGMDHAVLSRVEVCRGMPGPAPDQDPKPYARNQAQHAHWQRDARVTVRTHPLKYDYQRDEVGYPVRDGQGNRTVVGKREKGVDVLCALALVREARYADIDLVILASKDSDLGPALDEALKLNSAKVETFTWYDAPQRHRCGPVRPTDGRSLWNTRLGQTEFSNSWDRSTYP